MSGVALSTLVDQGIASRVVGDGSVVVQGVQHDSRAVRAGDLFVAIRGERFDGTSFASQAVQQGASAVLADTELAGLSVPVAVVPDARRALGAAADVVYAHPTDRLATIGITGTNGKTTTVWLTEAAIRGAGGRPAVLGTLGARGPAGELPGLHTTPEADDILRFARASLDANATHLVMEVSSHGLALHRVDAVRFRVAAFTNLTQDHLDFHGDLGAYGQAKARLFTELEPDVAVLNVDDPFGARLAEQVTCPRWRCSRRSDVEAEVRVLDRTASRDGIRARVATPGGEVELSSPLVGEHNLDNALVAFGCALALGLDASAVVDALRTATGAPGRLERVAHPGGVAVFVDYAHTPDALERVLAALRPITPGRLVTVFGCGGDRDRAKRAPMGAAVGRAADLAVLTSDNPRTEDPARIVADTEPGLVQAGVVRCEPGELADAQRAYAVEPDRRAAIRWAVRMARPGDTVLIAGKGHEDYLEVGTEKRPFDDRVEARRAIESGTARGGQA
ncbi:MAG: UDP-N-acetylmuramoyl-L-alanyl-D-glutamate--2,6-diaminopimelate ligase [Myxococcota bacterium]